jgi:acetolactate synthase-1/2/3 large subunit
MKLVDALVIALRDWDVRYVFGVSGANIEHVHDAIHRLGEGKLESVLAKSEVGAAFMADARARVHRTLGVCCATSGGGMMNLAVGIAEAHAESVPMLAIIGQVPTALEGRGGFQDSSGIGRSVDARALFGAMAKHVARIDAPDAFWDELARAARSALTGRQGPAVLLVPRDIYDRDVPPMPASFPRDLAALARPEPVTIDAIAPLFDALRSAKRPVLVAGTGVSRSSDPAAFVAFARAAQIPVVTTMGDAAAFPNDDPLWLGVVGAAGHPSAHAYLEEEADLVVAVGTGLNVMTRQPITRALERCTLAAVNVDAGELVRTAHASIVVEADAGEAFRALGARWDETPFSHAPIARYALTRYRPVLVDPPASGHRHAAPLLQSEALATLEPSLPEGGHILFDAGNCAAAALHYLAIPSSTTSTIALGMGGMGYAIAGAIGAQLGDARGRSVVLCGDGAFLMLGFEVHTAAALRLPILFIVFNNQKHGMCVTRQKLYFEGRVECSAYADVDVATIARGLGSHDKLWVGRASTRAELCARLDEYGSLSHARTGVLELDLAVEEVPPFAPFLREDELETYVAREHRDGVVRRVARRGVRTAA